MSVCVLRSKTKSEGVFRVCAVWPERKSRAREWSVRHHCGVTPISHSPDCVWTDGSWLQHSHLTNVFGLRVCAGVRVGSTCQCDEYKVSIYLGAYLLCIVQLNHHEFPPQTKSIVLLIWSSPPVTAGRIQLISKLTPLLLTRLDVGRSALYSLCMPGNLSLSTFSFCCKVFA